MPDENLHRSRGIGYSRTAMSWKGARREKRWARVGKNAIPAAPVQRRNPENKKAILKDGLIA
jgi:hypothetical protein